MNYRLKMSLPVLGMFVLFACVALVILASENSEIKRTLPPSLDNLTAIKLVEVRDSSGHVVLSGSFTMTAEGNEEFEEEAKLESTGPDAQAAGNAEVEISSQNVDNELEIEVWKLAPGTTYHLYVDG